MRHLQILLIPFSIYFPFSGGCPVIILKNEIYTGTLITHKKRTVNIRGKIVKIPKEEHFIFENHHEPIISKETFNLAQELRNKRKKQNTSGANKKRNYFG